MDTLAGKVILITGASRGIGKALACDLAKAGAKLALVARDSEKLEALRALIKADGGTALSFAANVTDAAWARQIVQDCQTQLGPLDILVNNAGTFGSSGPIWQCDIEDAWNAVEVNLRGPMVYMHAVLPEMVHRKGGIILNMGSYASIQPNERAPAYAAAKAALARYSDSVAATTGQHGVSIFTISPGLVQTDMTRNEPQFQNLPAEAWSPLSKICELVRELAGGNYAALSGRFLHVRDDLSELLSKTTQIEKENLYRLSLRNLDDTSL